MMKKICAVLVLAVLGACTTVADFAGFDTEQLNEHSAKRYTAMLDNAKQKKTLDVSSPTAYRVHRVFGRMVPFANQANRTGVAFNWQMNVFRDDNLNAWAMPGGKMGVYSGIVERLKLTDEEIAVVVGHEMTHALLEHSKNEIGAQILASLGGSILAAKTGVHDDLVGLGADLLVLKPFSRHQETEADLGGMRLMAQAGYNPEAAVRVWEKMQRVNQSGTQIALLSTHPAHGDRIARIKQALPDIMPLYRASGNARKKG